MESEQQQRRPLYTPTGMAIAAAFGTLLAGVFMLVRNYGNLGYPKLALKVAFAGWGLFLIIVLATTLLPQNSLELGLLFTALQAGLAYAAGRILQGSAIEYQQRDGGRVHSNWTAVSVGLLTAMALLGLLLITGALFGQAPPATG